MTNWQPPGGAGGQAYLPIPPDELKAFFQTGAEQVFRL
jgi:hypothetical protein